MGKHYKLDRVEVPRFYVPVTGCTTHSNCEGKVFTTSAEHSSSGWISVGYVSKQTPMGQGTFLGFPVDQLREATKEEILTALENDHPFGKSFRPHCEAVANASFHLAMASATANWTNDNAPDNSILGVSKKEIKDASQQASDHHDDLMRRWGAICKMQIEAIQKSLS